MMDWSGGEARDKCRDGATDADSAGYVMAVAAEAGADYIFARKTLDVGWNNYWLLCRDFSLILARRKTAGRSCPQSAKYPSSNTQQFQDQRCDDPGYLDDCCQHQIE